MIAALPSPSTGVLELGPLSLRAYGLCIAVGALVAVRLASARQDRRGGPPGVVESIAWWAVPAGLVGARLYHVATDWNRGDPSFADEPLRIFKIWEGGLGIWGGVAPGSAVGCLVAARLGARPLRLLDVAAPAIPVAQAIGRLGNWFNQELFGRPTDLPWGLRIDVENRPLDYAGSETFHPTFLYEALWCLIVAGLLVVLERRKRLKPGQLFALYVALYTVGRLAIETLRIDEATQIGTFRVNELVAPAVGVLALLAYVLLGRRDEEPRTAPELEAEAIARAERAKAAAASSQADEQPLPAADEAAFQPVEETSGDSAQPRPDSAPAEPPPRPPSAVHPTEGT